MAWLGQWIGHGHSTPWLYARLRVILLVNIPREGLTRRLRSSIWQVHRMCRTHTMNLSKLVIAWRTSCTKQKKTKTNAKARAENDVQMTNHKGGLSDSIPINSYIAVVGVHTTLWAFVALYLPRTTLTEWEEQQLSSRDRPQHPFLVALTQNPTWTLGCICLGAGLVQSWWAGRVKRWSLDLFIRGTEEEKRMQRAKFYESNKVIVRLFRLTMNSFLFLILK